MDMNSCESEIFQKPTDLLDLVPTQHHNEQQDQNSLPLLSSTELTSGTETSDEDYDNSSSNWTTQTASLSQDTSPRTPQLYKGFKNAPFAPLSDIPPLLSLPVDALHCISGFCEIREWCCMSLVNHAAHAVCGDVFRRVRMHGFKCAVEIVTAWEAGEHGDAKELAALYLKSGVPIYPVRRRYAYRTLLWRMKMETSEMAQPHSNGSTSSGVYGEEEEASATTTNEVSLNESGQNNVIPALGERGAQRRDHHRRRRETQTIDRFYLERNEARDSGGYYLPTLTYLEEKTLFWRCRNRSNRRSSPSTSRSSTPIIQPFGLPSDRFGDGFGPFDANHHRRGDLGMMGRDDENYRNHAPDNIHLQTLVDPDAFDAAGPDGRFRPITAPARLPLQINANGIMTDVAHSSLMSPLSSSSSSVVSSDTVGDRHYHHRGNNRPKMTLKCHRHLMDRHYMGSPAVCVGREDGIGDTAEINPVSEINLAVDFFHPSYNSCYFPDAHGTSTSSDVAILPHRTYGSDIRRASISPIMPTRMPTLELHVNDPPRPITTLLGEEVAEAEANIPTTDTGMTLISPSSGNDTEPEIRNNDANRDDAVNTTTPPGPCFGEFPEAINTLGLELIPPMRRRELVNDDRLPGLAVPVRNSSVPFDDSTSVPLAPLGGGAAGFTRATFPFVELSVMNDVLPHSYSSAFGPEEDDITRFNCGTRSSNSHPSWRKRLRDLIRHYESKLQSYLGSSSLPHANKIGCCFADHASFNESLLDFWDECFSLTANIHYFDVQSPIPRASRLREFLTKPYPKALGTIQCEIERIRTIPKKKRRGGVKERLFPTYEYRLFLRDHQHRLGGGHGLGLRHHRQQQQARMGGNGRDGGNLEEDGHAEQSSPVDIRLDTVLMAAKCRVKKHGATSSLKGVNNYYLHTPQRTDVEQHFDSVNDPSVTTLTGYKNSIQKVQLSGRELGRVQSNFIGTEFQIFSPKDDHFSVSSKNPVNDDFAGAGEKDPGETISKVTDEGGNIGSSTKKSFSRRLRKSRRRTCGKLQEEDVESDRAITTQKPTTSSTPFISRFGSSWLRSRRVIADSTTNIATNPLALAEVEIGAITYTANLLGNRPRIMDVCIPKVNSSEWKNYCDSVERDRSEHNLGESVEETSMLSNLKLLQVATEQELLNNSRHDVPTDLDNPIDRATPDLGLLTLQNRPPWWNVELGAFVLNFGGRVSVASVKNFQLCDRHNHDDSMLQFGRIEGRHSFTMDFSYPLSAVQAFAIAISSLQSKISFG